MNFGWAELLIIVAVIVLLFGATKLPKLARSVGEAKREFQAGSGEDTTKPDTKAD